MLELTPVLDNSKDIPLYIQLYEYIKTEIQNDKIKPGTKLPSKRKLSQHLKISQNTIQSAYEQLCSEGYAESRPRKGIFITKIDNDLFKLSISTKEDKIINSSACLPANSETIIDFNYGSIDAESFPFATWRKLTFQSLFPENSDILALGDPQGDINLRKEISDYIFQSRGVKCSPKQIVLGAGTQILLTLLCMILGKNHIYAFENPGFNRARHVFTDQGINVIPIYLDEYGISIKELRQSCAKVVYVTPSHQFPSGVVMPVSRRLELLKWCREEDSFIIEDDYDSEFRYIGKPIPSLQCLDDTGRVIYMGTFSKSLIPSVRINYVVLPQELLNIYNDKFKIYNQTVSRLHQDTLYKFMRQGYWSRHLNKMRTVYRKKHTVLIAAINKYLNNTVKVKIIGESSGLHILLQIENGMSENQLITSAMDMDVKVYPTSVYYYKHNKNEIPCIMLGFGALSEDQINLGIKTLKRAWNI